MTKKRNKSKHCLNCGLSLKQDYEYCPKCGQENSDSHISFKSLINEFFSNYFSFDSRFGRSVKPFFLQPGTLTREFMEGKRVKYANPVRLYLVISLIHFFFFSIYQASEIPEDRSLIKTKESNPEIIASQESADSIIASIPDETTFILSTKEWKIVTNMTIRAQQDYPIQQIEDSIHLEQKGAFTRRTIHQVIKLMKSNKKDISAYIISKIPILMFFLLPLYALILKAFFTRRLYITHLIHSLHIHSFAFLLFTIGWIIGIISFKIYDRLDWILLLLVFAYIVRSFKTTYEIKYREAIIKVFFGGLAYSIFIGLGLGISTVISLFFY